MAKLEVLFGDFTFIEPRLIHLKRPIKDGIDPIYDNFPWYDGLHKAIVNRVDAVFYVEEEKLDDFCEKGLESYESYLIPDLYTKYGEIIGNTLLPNHYIKRY